MTDILSLDNKFLNEEAKRVINLLKKDFVFPDGSFFLEKDGNKIFKHHIFPDLGDFIIFFLYFGETEFVYKQIDLFKKSLADGLLISEYKSFGISGLAKSYDYTDLLIGLFDLYMHDKNQENKIFLIESTNTAVKIFNLKGKVRSYYYPKFKVRLPLVDTRDGTFIEFFCDMYEETKNSEYLYIANNIFNQLVKINYYRKTGFLPEFDSPGYIKSIFGRIVANEKYNTSPIIKNDTNSLFGFLALAKKGNKNALIEIWRMVDSIMKLTENTDGAIPLIYNPEVVDRVSSLPATFPMIDFLCDLYEYTKDVRAIEYAKKLADFWIGKQGKTGLFPKNSNDAYSWFDSETDMSVSLYKLWEISDDVKYKNSADLCTLGILKYHGSRDYVLMVDINNGSVINSTQRTKFIALFLKLIILRIEYNKGSKIYANKNLFDLLRDR